MNTDQSLLHLMRLVSPALPVGAYVYSQGLEAAVDKRWVFDDTSTEDWLRGTLTYGIGRLDAPVFLRLYSACAENEIENIKSWNQFLLASRETSELLLEDTQMGAALIRLLKNLSVANYEHLPEEISFATAFALSAVHWQVDQQQALRGLLWSWLENQVAAAIKLVPLGQTQGQQLLITLTNDVQATAEKASKLSDREIGWSLPRLAMGSMQHEIQYSRLFRS